nr:tenascin-X-like [Lytechinus pictus]
MSSSLNVTWKTTVSIIWSQVQYKRTSDTSDLWVSTNQLQPSETEVLLSPLVEDTAYSVRVLVTRMDASSTISDVVQMKTCVAGFRGLNCEIKTPVVTSTPSPTTMQTSPPTEATTIGLTTPSTMGVTSPPSNAPTTITAPLYIIETIGKTSTSLTFSWALQQASVAQVSVEYKPNLSQIAWTQVPASSPEQTSFTINGLAPAISYDIRLMLVYEDTTEAYGDTYTLQTCSEGFRGVDCQTAEESPYRIQLTHVNSLSITTEWTSPTSATDVVLQYRISGGTWNNGSVVARSRGFYILTGLDDNESYDLRGLFAEEQSVEFSDVISAMTCEQGFAGETMCDTDYSEVGAYDVVLNTATSTSLTITWAVSVSTEWHMVQYR